MLVNRVLVTGAAGFLGSNLVDALLKDGYEVVGVDNFITGREINISHLKNNKKWKFIKANIINPLPKELTDLSFTHIVNLACPASPPDYQAKPLETLRVNSVGLENILELAIKNKARFTHTSTSEVYGDPSIHPQIEEYWGNVNSYGERSCYDEGKRYAEALIFSYRKVHSLNSGITRIFNTYGPRMSPNDGRVITNFIHQALSGDNITIYGDGNQTRSFCFVDDQVRAQVAMLFSAIEGPINVGNPTEFTIKELAERVIELTSSKSKLIYKPLPSDDPKRRQPDIAKARDLLNWQPEITLAEGLEQMINWIKQETK